MGHYWGEDAAPVGFPVSACGFLPLSTHFMSVSLKILVLFTFSYRASPDSNRSGEWNWIWHGSVKGTPLQN